jgi:hypothetical protein
LPSRNRQPGDEEKESLDAKKEECQADEKLWQRVALGLNGYSSLSLLY